MNDHDLTAQMRPVDGYPTMAGIPPVRYPQEPRGRLFPRGWRDAAWAAFTLLLAVFALNELVLTVILGRYAGWWG